MNSKLTLSALSLINFPLLLFSCSKVEGEGGAATIKGKITVKDYNNAGTTLQDTYPGADRDVYIVYGNENTFYDNDIKQVTMVVLSLGTCKKATIKYLFMKRFKGPTMTPLLYILFPFPKKSKYLI